MFSCQSCSKQYKTQLNLNKHLEKIHNLIVEKVEKIKRIKINKNNLMEKNNLIEKNNSIEVNNSTEVNDLIENIDLIEMIDLIGKNDSIEENNDLIEENKNDYNNEKLILNFVDKIHQILYKESIVGANALNDILNIIFLYLIKERLSGEKLSVDLLDFLEIFNDFDKEIPKKKNNDIDVLYNYTGYLLKIDDNGNPIEQIQNKKFIGKNSLIIPYSFSHYYLHLDLLYCELIYTDLLAYEIKNINDVKHKNFLENGNINESLFIFPSTTFTVNEKAQNDHIKNIGCILKNHYFTGNMFCEDKFLKLNNYKTLKEILEMFVDSEIKEYATYYANEKLKFFKKHYGTFKNIFPENKNLYEKHNDIKKSVYLYNGNEFDEYMRVDIWFMQKNDFLKGNLKENLKNLNKNPKNLKNFKKSEFDYIDFDNVEDAIGKIYESFINKYMKNDSKLGQFFTPRKMINFILDDYKNEILKTCKLFENKQFENKLFENNSISVADYCMGTGGWIVAFFNKFNKDIKNLDYYGGEIETSTFKYCHMNLINSIKTIKPNNFFRNDSLTQCYYTKHNFILSNPPFGLKIKYEDVISNFNHNKGNKELLIDVFSIYKFKSDDSNMLFLQLYLYLLENDGICIIVLPSGQLFNGNGLYKEFREKFIIGIEIIEIIICEKGTFAHTGVGTCILIFRKKINGTEKIIFSELKKDCKEKTLIKIITLEEIKNNKLFSWSHKDYETIEIKENNEYVTYKKLGEICEIKNGKPLKKEEFIDGKYNVISGSIKSLGKHNEYNVEKNTITISKDGTCGFVMFHKKKVFVANHAMYITNIDKNINVKYLYNYLKINQEKIENLKEGSVIYGINKEKLKEKIIVVYPNLEEQEEIIKKIDEHNLDYDIKIKTLEKEIKNIIDDIKYIID